MSKKQRPQLGRGLLAAAILSVTASPAPTQVIDWTGEAATFLSRTFGLALYGP